jgi:2,3-bisphosphoglycerate-dependent phosphoglycerate mutase
MAVGAPFTSMTTLLLIRHGHVNTNSRLCGWYDVPLSSVGRRHLNTLLDSGPRHLAPDALYSSPLRRALDVAAALGRAWSLPAHELEALREIHCGWLEGMRIDELQRTHAQLWASNLAQSDDQFRWPGGECYAAFRARVLDALCSIAKSHAEKRVAVVTHAGVISQVLGTIRGRPAAVWEPDRPAPLTSTEVTWVGNLPHRVLRYGDADWY